MWNKINTYMPWAFIEFVIYLIIFSFVSKFIFPDDNLSYVKLVASGGLYLGIRNRHDNKQ